MTDPIADMIVRIKNARATGKDAVTMPQSSLKYAIATKLKERGILSDVATHGKKTGKVLEVTLGRTEGGAYRFTDARRISKPGRRSYLRVSDIQSVRGGTGFLVLSTPQGILFGDEARKANVGGEPLFEVW